MNGKQGRKPSNVLDTMAQLIAELEKRGVESWKVRKAKKIPGLFRKGGRADPDEVFAYIQAHPDQFAEEPKLTKEEADIRLKEARIRKLDHEVAILKREAIPVSEIDEQGTLIGTIINGKMMSVFVNELPARTAGMDETGIREKNREAVVAIMNDLHSRLTWYQEQPEKKD